RRDDDIELQIAVAGGGWADVYRHVGLSDVARLAVRIGIDRDGPDAEAAAGPHDAYGDLAAIGDQDALEHRITYGRPGDGPAVRSDAPQAQGRGRARRASAAAR